MVGVGSLVTGVLLILIFGLDLGWFPFILGALGIKLPVWGFLYLYMSPCVVYHDSMEVKNMYGMTLRNIEFGAVTDLEIREDQVYYLKGGQWKKLRQLKRKRLHPQDWGRLVTWIQSGELPLKPKDP